MSNTQGENACYMDPLYTHLGELVTSGSLHGCEAVGIADLAASLLQGAGVDPHTGLGVQGVSPCADLQAVSAAPVEVRQ